MINIKLDKTGGLTEGLLLADDMLARGLDVMVGNMLGTSLAMAPAYVVALKSRIADLDGPVALRSDRIGRLCTIRAWSGRSRASCGAERPWTSANLETISS